MLTIEGVPDNKAHLFFAIFFIWLSIFVNGIYLANIFIYRYV